MYYYLILGNNMSVINVVPYIGYYNVIMNTVKIAFQPIIQQSRGLVTGWFQFYTVGGRYANSKILLLKIVLIDQSYLLPSYYASADFNILMRSIISSCFILYYIYVYDKHKCQGRGRRNYISPKYCLLLKTHE